MMKSSMLLVSAVGIGYVSNADFNKPPVPYDVPPLLVTTSGKPVCSREQWETLRRPEIERILLEQEYGMRPVERPADLAFSESATPEVCYGGKAIRKRIRATYSGPGGSGDINFSVWIPRRSTPAPVFIHSSPRPSESADDVNAPRHAYWLPVDDIVSRGFAVVAYCNQDVAEDCRGSDVATSGVFKVFGPERLMRRGPTEWGILSAWAWGMSRILDWVETEPLLDAKRAAAVGLSRNGKTALFAGAFDKRFALTVSCCSGCSGAKLNHISLLESEHIVNIVKLAEKWFCPNYTNYVGRDCDAVGKSCDMPFDQHFLLALVAPRLLYVSSATEDAWAGPRGEFAALELASPVWQLYGKPGLVAHGFPKADVPFNAGTLGYHLRTGVHDITRYDWQCYMDFAEAHGWLNSLGRDDGASADAGRSSIVLAERGGRAGAVFCPPDASKRMLKAADEYATYVERIVGVRPEIVSSPGSAVVLLEQDESKSLGVDGFRLCAKDGKLRVTGGQRGVLYGIYEILETYCGVGWFSSWHEVVPTRDELSVPADLDEVQRPAFEVRDALWYDVMSNAEFADRLRINGGSFGFDNVLGTCHTFDILVPPSKYFKTHPEYFAFFNGRRQSEGTQLCLTNKDVLRIVTEGVLARLRLNPSARFVGVSQNDCQTFCECESCKAVDDEEESHAGTMIHFVNAVAERVEREFPGVVVETLAYQYTRKPPKHVRPRHNVMPCLCTVECDFGGPLAESCHLETVGFGNELRTWSGMSKRLFVWDYTVNFRQYMQAFANFDSMHSNIRLFRDSGVRYLREQGDWRAYHAFFGELKLYLLAKWMWNPDLPVEPLLERFFTGYYGAAAPFARQYYDRLLSESRAHWRGGRNPTLIYMPITDAPPDMNTIEWADQIWKRAEDAVRNESETYRYNVRMSALWNDYQRIMQSSRYITKDPVKTAAAKGRSALASSILARSRSGRKVFFRDSGNASDVQLLERMAGSDTARGSFDKARLYAPDFPVWMGKFQKSDGETGRPTYRFGNGRAAWNTVFGFEDVAFDEGVDYVFRVHLKCVRAKDAPDGEVFWAGVWDESKNAQACANYSLQAKSLKNEWGWYDVGVFRPGKKTKLWISPGRTKWKSGEKPAFDSLLVDAIEIAILSR